MTSKWTKMVLGCLVAGAVAVFGLFMNEAVVRAADKCGEGQVETSILGENGCADVGQNGEGIFSVLNIVLTVMTYGVGILATVGIVSAGYQYLTAKDDVSQMQKAKSRIFQVVIGLVLYALLWLILEFLLPGGLFGKGNS